MKNLFALIFLVVALSVAPRAAAVTRCPIEESNAVIPFCTEENNLGITFPAGTTDHDIQDLFSELMTGGAGCLHKMPSPSWFIFQIEEDGDIRFSMKHSNGKDIDFACWGPFEGINKMDVLSQICGNPSAYFKSPNPKGSPYINMCEVRYKRFIDSTFNACFESKTGTTTFHEKEYPKEAAECRAYAEASVPEQLENDYVASQFMDPESPNSKDCFLAVPPDFYNQVDCSYSPSFSEYCFIPNAKRAEWYVILITNYSKEAGDISFKKIGGAASTNCKIIIDVMSTGPYCEGDEIHLYVNNAPSGVSYEWRGPNGFTSTESEPRIANATIDAAGTYYVRLKRGAVESEEVEVDVVVSPASVVDTTVVIKPGKSYLFGEQTLTKTGEYVAHFRNSLGCDSTVHLSLIVSDRAAVLAPVKPVCEGEDVLLDAIVDEDSEINCVMQWVGPGNFSFFGKRAVIREALAEQSGAYTFMLTSPDGKVLKEETEVVVKKRSKVEADTAIVQGTSLKFGEETITESGVYTQTFSNVAGCDSVVTLNVFVSEIAVSNTGPYCEGAIIQLSAEGETQGLEFEWEGPNGFKSKRVDAAIDDAQRQHAGLYSLYIVDGSRRTKVGSTQVAVNENVVKKAVEQLEKGQTIPFGELLIDKVGEYTQKFVSATGCDSTVTLVVRMDLEIVPDEFFTPNGDGEHDRWQIENIENYPEAIVIIYDRHGKVVRRFEAYDNNDGWDGTDLNNNKLPATDYWYTVNISETDKIYVGHVTLMR